MAARVQIVVEVQNVGGGILRGITSELGGLGRIMEEMTGKNVNWGNVATQVTQMVVKGLKDSIKATVEYSAQVRDQALASGQGAEAASRMLQVMDDYQLSADDAATATKALTREGLAPTIDTIAKLSGEYLKLNSAEDKNAFLMKNLGKAGKEWMNLMSQGPNAIMEMNAAVSDSLILTDANIRASEEYRLALDEWGDAVQGAKIEIGTGLLPVLTDLMKHTMALTEADKRLVEEGLKPGTSAYNQRRFELIELIKAEQEGVLSAQAATVAWSEGEKALNGLTLSMQEQEAATKAADEAAKALSETNKGFVSVLSGVISENQKYTESQTLLKDEQALLLAEKQKLIDQGWNPEGTRIGEVNAKLDENMAKMEENKAAHSEWTKAKMADLLLQKLSVDGLEKKELAYYLSFMTHADLMTAEDAEMTAALIDGADQLVAAFDETSEAIDHAGLRALDASEKMDTLNESQAELGSDIRRDALASAASLSRELSGIPGYITSTVDLFINRYTNTYAGAGANTTSSSAALDALRNISGGGRQSGGSVYAGNPYTVGERGAERFVPSQDGRILGHAESLHAMGLGGGGGMTNYFYGNVTIAPDSEGGGDLLSIR